MADLTETKQKPKVVTDNDININTASRPAFFVGLVKKGFAAGKMTMKLGGIGNAIISVADTIELLRIWKVAKITKIQTSQVSVMKGNPVAKLSVEIERGEKWNENVTSEE